MITANVADLKTHISDYLKSVTAGESITICMRNQPVAMITPIAHVKRSNGTKLGCGKNSITIQSDLTEPVIPESDWNMLNP